MKKNWKDLKVTVLGLSKSGEASAIYLFRHGATCTISEHRAQTDADVELITALTNLGITVEMGGNKEETILQSDLIVTSPGIPPHAKPIMLAKENNIEVISEPELAYRATNIPIIAITGTNGKTTTTTLTSKIFTEAGFNAPVCGNIGIPIISLIDDPQDYLIAELSSFQLYYSPLFKPLAGVFLNYSPDHIDWHGTEDAYEVAKTGFLQEERSPAWVVLNVLDPVSQKVAAKTTSQIYWFGDQQGEYSCYLKDGKYFINEKGKETFILNKKDVQIIGKHNDENIMAAITAARIANIDISAIAQGVKDFKAVEHRIEFVDTIEGVAFYNDSKATNCDASICALRAFEERNVVLIAGGRDKMTDLTTFVKEIKTYAKAVILLGEAKERFKTALVKEGYENIHEVNTMEEAISLSLVLKLGPVLLSPACSSYDMYKNFEERGNAFKQIVKAKKIDA